MADTISNGKPPEENTIDLKVSTEKVSQGSKLDKVYTFNDEEWYIKNI